MTEGEAASPEEVVELWRRRFGQPPPIVAEPEMMLKILRTAPPVREEARTWVEAD